MPYRASGLRPPTAPRRSPVRGLLAVAAPAGDPDALTLWSRRLDLAFEPATEEDGLIDSPGFATATRYELEWARGEMCVRAVTLHRGGMGHEGVGASP